jgi:polyisoprenoid-binding protein YceI
MLKKILALIALVVLVVVGAVAYLYLKPTEAASQPIEAIPLVIETETTAEEAAATGSTEEAVAESATATETMSSETVNNEAVSSDESTTLLFEIVSAESEARFIIDEVLNGTPTTVVGTTDQVAGQLAVDTTAVENTQIGIIQINARTLATDSDMRNRAISNRILYTDEYEYITFTPTAIIGLPESVNVGDALTFQVTGDLTIRDVTQQVAFDMQVTAVAEDRLEGLATTTIEYADFGITIPNVPSVTGVSDTVSLELDFAATTI